MARWIRAAGALFCALAVSAPAAAQDTFAASRGFYLAVSGGASFLQSIDFKIEDSSSNKATFDTGWMAALAVGYGLQNGFRAEIEGAHRHNGIDQFRRLEGSGSLNASTLMVNGYYDINLNDFPIVPYIGVGIGMARINGNGIKRNLVTCCPQVDGSDTVFAYQAIAGLSWRLMPALSIGVEYRFLGTTRFNLDAESAGIRTGARGHYHDHAAVLNLRWTFGK